jgi:hypothetical protein
MSKHIRLQQKRPSIMRENAAGLAYFDNQFNIILAEYDLI